MLRSGLLDLYGLRAVHSRALLPRSPTHTFASSVEGGRHTARRLQYGRGRKRWDRAMSVDAARLRAVVTDAAGKAAASALDEATIEYIVSILEDTCVPDRLSACPRQDPTGKREYLCPWCGGACP